MIRRGIDPRQGEIVLRAKRAVGEVSIVGRVLKPNGEPLAHASVSLWSPGEASGRNQPTQEGTGGFEFQARPGTWSIHVWTREYPNYRSEERELVGGERWDLETIQLTAGGTVRVEVDGVEPAEVSCRLETPAGKFADYLDLEDDSSLRSDLVLPGHYRVRITGEGIDEQTRDIEIRADEETVVRFELK